MLKDYNYSSSVLWISWNGSFSRSFILLPYLGLQSNQKSKRLKSCIYQFYSCVNLKIIFQNTCHIKSFFPCKDRLNRSQRSKVIYKACCWHCNDFYVGKIKLSDGSMIARLNTSSPTRNDHSSAIDDHITATGHNIKSFWNLSIWKNRLSLCSLWDKRTFFIHQQWKVKAF